MFRKLILVIIVLEWLDKDDNDSNNDHNDTHDDNNDDANGNIN